MGVRVNREAEQPLGGSRRGRKHQKTGRQLASAVVRGERLTPPCVGCKYPLLRGERSCPRCGRAVAL